MDRREFLKRLAIVGGAASFAVYPFATDFLIKEAKLNNLRKSTKATLDNIVNLTTVVNYTIDEYPDLKNKVLNEQGLIFGDYIITANHTVSSPFSFIGVTEIRTPFGIEKIETLHKINKLKEVTTTKNKKTKVEYTLEVVLKDPERDMAIFELPETYKKPKTGIKIGDSDKLKLYDNIYLVSDPFNLHSIPTPRWIGSEEEKVLEGNSHVKYSSTGLTSGIAFYPRGFPGDSGSPILNKKGELVGIAVASNSAYGLFKPINLFLEEIEKYESGKNEEIMSYEYLEVP